jgi:membrane-associated protease RseP (regulator of RpoE activity)
VSWFLAFVGFALLVILHELGHFWAAKAVGMRVEKFSLFFPPTLASVKRGETEYAIGAIPAGGYVKISGMNPSEDLPDEVRTRAYYAQPVWKRIVVIAAGPAMNLLIAFLVLFALAFGVREATGQVGEVENDSPAQGKLRPGDEILAVIKSTATNHSGYANGFHVPNPHAQAQLIIDNFIKSGIDPRTIAQPPPSPPGGSAAPAFRAPSQGTSCRAHALVIVPVVCGHADIIHVLKG